MSKENIQKKFNIYKDKEKLLSDLGLNSDIEELDKALSEKENSAFNVWIAISDYMRDKGTIMLFDMSDKERYSKIGDIELLWLKSKFNIQ